MRIQLQVNRYKILPHQNNTDCYGSCKDQVYRCKMKWLKVFFKNVWKRQKLSECLNLWTVIKPSNLSIWNKGLSSPSLGSAHTVLTPYWSKQLGKKKLYGNFSSVFCKITSKLHWFKVNKLQNKLRPLFLLLFLQVGSVPSVEVTSAWQCGMMVEWM